MTIFQKHKTYWIKKTFIASVILGLVLMAASVLINNYAQAFAASHISNSVTDILLDNIPPRDVHLIYSEGAIIFVLILIAVLFYEPKHTPFVLKSIALFIVIRSLFMVLTHLAPPVSAIYINPTDYVQSLSQGDDLFFSGHTGLPALLTYIFWENKYLRYLFLVCTIIGGTAVILGHLHYSIDVFSALFISFGIFHISKNIFYTDYKLSSK
ncbi:MAG: phosphatase PAP2-related protein [Candidatus Falkowbacteria bacterium]